MHSERRIAVIVRRGREPRFDDERIAFEVRVKALPQRR